MPRSTTFAIQDSGRRDSRRRIFALTLLAGFAPQVAVFGGVKYVAATETSSGDKGRIAVEAEGAGIRVEFQDAGDEMFSRGDVLVSADSGATVYLLDVKKQRYSEIDLRALARITGRILKGIPGVFGLEIAAPRVEKLFEVDGPEMLGHATRHARYLLSYEERERLTTPARGGVESTKTESWHQIVQDVWFMREIGVPSHDFWLRDRFRSGYPELDRLLAAENSLLEGFPLRVDSFEARSTRELSHTRVALADAGLVVSQRAFVGDTVKKRDLATSQRSMVVVELETEDAIPPARFAPPEGYRKLDRSAAR